MRPAAVRESDRLRRSTVCKNGDRIERRVATLKIKIRILFRAILGGMGRGIIVRASASADFSSKERDHAYGRLRGGLQCSRRRAIDAAEMGQRGTSETAAQGRGGKGTMNGQEHRPVGNQRHRGQNARSLSRAPKESKSLCKGTRVQTH